MLIPGLGLMVAAMLAFPKSPSLRDRRATRLGLAVGLLASSCLFGWMWLRVTGAV
jgi:hypothetical protein